MNHPNDYILQMTSIVLVEEGTPITISYTVVVILDLVATNSGKTIRLAFFFVWVDLVKYRIIA